MKVINKKNNTPSKELLYIIDYVKKQSYGNYITSINMFLAKLNKDKTDFVNPFTQVDLDEVINTNEEDTILNNSRLIFEAKSLSKELENKSPLNEKLHQIVIKNFSENSPFKFFIHNYFDNYSKKFLTPISVSNRKVEIKSKITESEDFYKIGFKFYIENTAYTFDSNKLIFSNYFIIYNQAELIPIHDFSLCLDIKKYKEKSEYLFIKKSNINFIEQVFKPISKKHEIIQSIIKKEKRKTQETNLVKQVYLSDTSDQNIKFEPMVQYTNQTVSILSKEQLISEDQNKNPIIISRNEDFEDDFLEQFKSYHPEFNNSETNFVLPPEELLKNFWFLHTIDIMKQQGIEVYGDKDLKSFKFNLNKPVISYSTQSNIDWFDLEISVAFGKEKVSLKDIQKAILKKSNYLNLNDGTIGILPEDWIKKFANYFKAGEVKKDVIRISNYQFGIIDDLYNHLDEKPEFLQELYQKKNVYKILKTWKMSQFQKE